jgi:uncharacterized membrane protein
MPLLKLIHVLSLFIWLGSLLTLGRLFLKIKKEQNQLQYELLQIIKKSYFTYELPALIVALLSGLWLIKMAVFGPKLGWFHSKLMFAFFLVLIDLTFLRSIIRANEDLSFIQKKSKFKLLHIATYISLIGVLFSIYFLRNKENEIIERVTKNLNKQENQALYQKP